jgi:hypothetical protein
MQNTTKYTNVNCTLLELLKQDAKVTFRNGTWLKGDSDTKYIEVGTEISNESQGVWFLTEEGLCDALKDLKEMYKELHPEEEEALQDFRAGVVDEDFLSQEQDTEKR